MSNNIIVLPNTIREYRKKCRFENKGTQILDEEGKLHKYPCIGLYDDAGGLIYQTGLERFLRNLNESEFLDEETLDIRAYAVCHFLNYILWETEVNAIHECNLTLIRKCLASLKTKKDGSEYPKETWAKYKAHICDFLVLYYNKNCERLPFMYSEDELKSQNSADYNKYGRNSKFQGVSLFIKAPRSVHKKNRVLIDGYLDLIIYEAKKYNPPLALAIGMGAYAGIREGGIVNTTFGRIKTHYGGYGVLDYIDIDIRYPAQHFENWPKKTKPGNIKKYRLQKVYFDFTRKFQKLFEDHTAWMVSNGYDTSSSAPLFLNRQGKPMSVQVFSKELKDLFYDHFLPDLKESCKRQNTYADNAAYIEAYEQEYPGAHMLRHWFTMYLLVKAKLSEGEVMKWRGDSSQESMNDYIHENQELIESFKKSSYAFQSQIMEAIYAVY